MAWTVRRQKRSNLVCAVDQTRGDIVLVAWIIKETDKRKLCCWLFKNCKISQARQEATERVAGRQEDGQMDVFNNQRSFCSGWALCRMHSFLP